jgi:hypothetical protein
MRMLHCLLIAALPAATATATTFTTSATYDPAARVDFSGTTDSGQGVSLATFTAAVAAAHAGNYGGVAHFDEIASGASHASLDLGLGSSGPTVSVTPGALNSGGQATWNNPFFLSSFATSSSGRTPVSPPNYLSGPDYDFVFAAADQVTAAGITLMSRNQGSTAVPPYFVTVDVTASFSNGSSLLVVDDYRIEKGNGTYDTFFGVEAPAGQYLTGLTLNTTSDDGNNNGFSGVDNLGVIAVPEPATGVLALIPLLLVPRRRR